jgi:DNA-binding transcriptional LysR family regulator
MELRHLRYFVAVAEALSFTKAARHLRLAQPSLTRQVRNLENEIGVELLNRSHNRVSLTAAGRRFFADAKKLLAQCAEMVVTAQQPEPDEAAEINIGYVAHSHPPFLASTIAAFRKMRPGVIVNLFDMSRAEQCLALRDGRIDVGFVGLDPSYHGSALESIPVGLDDIVAAVPSQSLPAKGRKLAMQDLSSFAFVAMAGTSNPGAREWLVETCAEAGFACRVLQEADEETEALKFVADGFGVALITQKSPPVTKKGVLLHALTPPLHRTSKMAWRAENVSENLAEYIRIVKDLRAAE